MQIPRHTARWLGLAASMASAGALAQSTATPEQLDTVIVLGRRASLVGEAISASEGEVGPTEISARPMLRTGDLLEFVPGLVATQHSGSGKANQYFLRGFNLDHGTDFATWVDGMPVNMRTHGHGQGWTDLNFLIPETVETLTYRKGTYYADVGDFASTGSARFAIADKATQGEVAVTAGEHGYARAVVVDSLQVGGRDLYFAGELQQGDGPWTDIDEDVRKRNALVRYSGAVGTGRGHVMLMAYRNQWNSPDQIPERAVEAGLISEFGSLDTTVGGESSRYSLSTGWEGPAFGGQFRADAYVVKSTLDLWSDFTYFLDDPDNGDQFEQVDDRTLYGFSASQQWDAGKQHWRVGVEGRFDDIGEVGLFRTRDRARLSTVRDDAVEEGSLGVFVAQEYRFNDQWRSYLGVRRDEYDFKVDSSLAANSGDARDGRTSYKGSLAYRPSQALELYASYGTGFHSNDARGTTIRVDPVTGDPAQRVDALVPSKGYELGSRMYLGDRLQATLAAWSLHLDSELLFVGDAGITEPSRPSQRRGVELGVYWFGGERYVASFEASRTNARFTDTDAVGNEIPGSIPLVVSAGLTGRYAHGWTATAQLKHFGAYPLIEDGSVESNGSTLVNLRVGREWGRWTFNADLLNALDSDDHDIDYLYASRLQGEPAEGVEDVHFHVFAPRSLRLTALLRF
ncbi:TonB-dependent receptor [Lysobacter helvus]|uniref:TonB-dependent receptor n=2 Tax=Lysobacteraceae TaxID=32033 RepID=A0ABM7Q7B1_9GAMM|nr:MULTISPECIES: TonB-dependent receptor [Lysobacter]BCT93216.1 TonB-dependent receptor [Lysobacter caseinilyticus]BCT96368.1 TonB-dependent receptor [Lysobacter helvus]